MLNLKSKEGTIMKQFTIFQINAKAENARNFMYMGYDFIKEYNMKLTLDLYNKVYDGKIATANDGVMDILDDIYHDFNVQHPADFKGHSLSTSDIVLIDGKYYYCDSYGWVEVKFEQQSQEVPVQEQSGIKYITIYEVRGIREADDERIVLDRYLNKDDAEKYKKFCLEVNAQTYRSVYVMEQMVWC